MLVASNKAGYCGLSSACQCEEEPYLRGQGLDCVGGTLKEDLNTLGQLTGTHTF